MTQVVIKKALEFSTHLSRVHFFDVNELNFKTIHNLTEEEIKYNLKGEPLYRNLYFKDELAVKVTYSKLYADVEIDGVLFTDEFVSTKQTIIYYNDDGTIYKEVVKDGYKFILRPVTKNDEIVGVESSKRWQILKKQRYQADAELATESPELYKVLVDNFKTNYELYLSHGDGTKLSIELDNVLAISSPTTEQLALQGFLNHPLGYHTKTQLQLAPNILTVVDLVKEFIR